MRPLGVPRSLRFLQGAGGGWDHAAGRAMLSLMREFTVKLRYLHGNPVKRGLVKEAGDWKWSSFRRYALAGGPNLVNETLLGVPRSLRFLQGAGGGWDHAAGGPMLILIRSQSFTRTSPASPYL